MRSFACRAALQMLESLPDVSDDWIGVTQTELRLGIGVHTGIGASRQRRQHAQAKYGPRGPNVHLAKPSRSGHQRTGRAAPGDAADRRAAFQSIRGESRLPRQHARRAQPMDLYAVRSPIERDAIDRSLATRTTKRCGISKQGEFQEAARRAGGDRIAARGSPRAISCRTGRSANLAATQRRRSTDRAGVPRANGVIAARSAK